jgi:hypothetical protein
MPAFPETLRELLVDTGQVNVSSAGLEASAADDLKARVQGLEGVSWSAVSNTLSDAVAKALEVSMADILSGAWSKLQSLQEYRDPERHPPEEISMVPLAKHSITSSHKPSVELLSGEQVIATLTFTAEAKLVVEGAALKIQNARIMGLASGTFSGSGSLQFEGNTLLERSTKPTRIPGDISFGQGFAIPAIPEA